ncbi:hypothetical protein [Pseudomonas syringae]|uniref:hypothetical protein n=1 Tax=Pseudomonas syringae TaxID=317 RepID=UPI000BB612B1|nr:hypothetical protein [Pseudomonas syringae]MCH5509686.1 hypothetical protein [Pseudomonas syringae pv. syringae]MCH5638142.1 hypothetical protein [Pseudomonas syringae pv. syringae]MCH7429976.1 hypothetical protein [Pseudomonas syringae pv. syringae]PBP71659.1 hypothetical protein CCL21_07660 [Pseudomonas syringae]
MDLNTFRKIIDRSSPAISAYQGDLENLYDYVGLEHGSSYTLSAVSKALYTKIQDCFISGHAAVWRACQSLRTDLIREHTLLNAPLDPYFEVLEHLRDAVHTDDNSRATIEGDWETAIRTAFDHVQIQSWGSTNRRTIYARDFMVAEAARALRDAGYSILLEAGGMGFWQEAESTLVATIEELVCSMGGVNVARRIFADISKDFDPEQQRYHVVRKISMTGEGLPQVPWGYLLQLAAKHIQGRKPYVTTDIQWQKLCALSQAYAAVKDVQPYAPTFYGTMDAIDLVPYLQEMALYDTLFRIPQMRPSDVVKIARGMLGWFDLSKPTKGGWSVNQALEIIGYLLSPSFAARGPIFITEVEIRRNCPDIPPIAVASILDNMLSHPYTGANKNFSLPTDAPTSTHKTSGQDFFLRPLIRSSGRRFILLDRSVCAPACLEALLTQLRAEMKNLDDRIGQSIEDFLKSEFASHGLYPKGGEYDSGGEHGECDLALETADTIIFAEIKKKPLTRRAKAGSDAHILLDLAGSLLAAQAQAGWHEVRLRKDGYLNLDSYGTLSRIDLNGREIERVAVTLLDFGSFQDRILLKQFLEGTLNVEFTPSDANLKKDFQQINSTLTEIREQLIELSSSEEDMRQPFFHCWFLSVPQLLVLLDNVTDSASFKSALWSCRHIATGSSDLYFDLSYMKHLRRETIAAID